MFRALLTLAWNKTVMGESCSARGLQFRMTGPAKQEFPKRIFNVEQDRP